MSDFMAGFVFGLSVVVAAVLIAAWFRQYTRQVQNETVRDFRSVTGYQPRSQGPGYPPSAPPSGGSSVSRPRQRRDSTEPARDT